MTTHCTCHCRACGAHFTSLRAFDFHLKGTPQDRHCEIPESLVEREGVCKIAGATPILNVTVYEHASAERARERFAA